MPHNAFDDKAVGIDLRGYTNDCLLMDKTIPVKHTDTFKLSLYPTINQVCATGITPIIHKTPSGVK